MIRQVPEERIRTIVVREIVDRFDLRDPAHVDQRIMHKIGCAIAEKLFEFHKVKISDDGPAGRVYSVEFDVIVPEI